MSSMFKVKQVVVAIFIVIVACFLLFEWSYSDDMKLHIALVNHKLEALRLQTNHPGGAVDSVRTMSAVADAGEEIMSTHDHVHTLKDEVLAWKIKRAVEKSITVGDANQDAIAKWPGNN